VCFIFFSTAKAEVPRRNVALGKPAKQATTYAASHASNAVNGLFLIFNIVSCTVNTVHVWWAVDLLERFFVQEVMISTDGNNAFGNNISRVPHMAGYD